MNESCRKISRGQVWFLVDSDAPNVHNTNDHIQTKNRPWLVVSNNQCNQNSPVYTVVPLTSQVKNHMPTHVNFIVDGDKQNTILCEQIRSIPSRIFFNPGSSYRWTMSEKYMAMVDEALAVQLGLSLVFPNSERFWESLEKIIRVRVKQTVMDSKVDAIDVSKVASLLDARVESIVNDTVNPLPPVTEEKKEEPVIESSEPTPPLEEKKDFVPIKKPNRRSWTNEEKQEFLEYYDEHGAQATADQYDLQLGSVYATRFRFFKENKGEK